MINKSQPIHLNPFEVENLRDKLARKKNEDEFLKTYTSIYPEIQNKNTNLFWNKKFGKELELKDQDDMTKDKISKIVSLLPNKKCKILDLGFGQGYFEEKLGKSNRKSAIYGVDISSTAVKRAHKKFKGEFIRGDISQIDKFYQKSFFDVIVAIELIEHISPKKIFSFYRSVNSLLKRGGILIISTPLNEGLRTMKNNPSGHVRDYLPTVIKMELELSGFKVLETHQLYAFKKYYKLKKNLARVFPNHWKPNNIIVKAVKK